MVLKTTVLFLLLTAFLLQPFGQQHVFAQAEKQAGASATATSSVSELSQDRRIQILRVYLQTYNSPLAPYADVFVKEADKNNIDWKLLVSISGVESTFGQQIPYDCNNAWGWGIYGNNRTCFTSWDEAIKTISQGLRENYINKGAQDVYQIGKLYAASPTWAVRVDGFMHQIDAFALKDTNSLPISL